MNAPLNIDITQILLHILNLIILVGALALILYKPVCRFLKERREHYEKLEEENAAKAEECERLKNEYEKMLKESDDAALEKQRELEREAAQYAESYITEAKAKADAIVRAAEEEAESRKAHILESAQTEIGELVISATEKLMASRTSPEADSALYDEFIRTADGSEDDGGADE